MMKGCPVCGREADPADGSQKEAWFFRGSFLIFGFMVAGPLILPLVWVHPRYSGIKKLFMTGIILLLTFVLGAIFNESIKSIKHSYEQLISLPASGTRDALSVILERKSVRTYTAQPVSERDLNLLLRAGMAAPSAGDKRPWAFVAVTDKDKLNELGGKLPNAAMVREAGAAIIVCGLPEKALPGNEREFWIQDCSAASENILLAAEAMGLGAVWTGVYPVMERVVAVRQVLGIPEQVMVLNVIAVGHSGGNEKPKDKYNAVHIHQNYW